MAEYLPTASITAITDDVTVTAGKTIDGVDISTHTHTGAGTNGAKVAFANLSDVIVTSPIVGQMLLYNGSQWVNTENASPISGPGIVYYLQDTQAYQDDGKTIIADIDSVAVEVMSRGLMATDPANDTVAIQLNQASLITLGTYVDGAIGTAQIQSGIWSFNIFNYVSSAVPDTRLHLYVSKVDLNGANEVAMFNVTSDKLVYTDSLQLRTFTYTTNSATSIAVTDRLKFKLTATTDSATPITVHFAHSKSYPSSIQTPLPGKHDDLAGLEGGDGKTFYHLGLSEFTGTGTGVMVRKDAPTLTGLTILDSVGIDTIGATSQKLQVNNGNLLLSQVALPNAVPTLALGAAGVLTGGYYYSISYYTANGETTRTEKSALISPSSQKVELSNIGKSADPEVIGRKIYRTAAGGPSYVQYLVHTITNNVDTTYSDNNADNTLTDLGLDVNTTGGHIFVGSGAGKRVGIANENVTSWGYGAFATQTGLLSTSFGSYAMAVNTTGQLNIGIGPYALNSNTAGNDNIGIGYWALKSNILSGRNIAIGTYAMALNVSGNYNTAVGNQTLVENVSGHNNTGYGAYALGSQTASDNNVAVGYEALFNNEGAGNTAVGYYAGEHLTTGTYNVMIGYNAGQNASQKVDAVNSIAIGKDVYTTADNQTVIGNASVTSVTINGSIQSPTIVTPTVASLVNMNHTHAAVGATGGVIDHVNLSNIGTTTHANIDSHIANTTTAHGAVATATASKLMVRDGAGRVAVVAPSAAGDVAILSTVTDHAAVTATHGATGAVVGTTNVQALTNKIITYTAGTIAAGTAPIKLTAGPVLTTPEAGTLEFDASNIFYASTGTGRGVVPSKKIAIIATPLTLANSTNAQSWLPAANDVLTVAGATTYMIKSVIAISGIQTGSNYTVATGFTLGGSASITDVGYLASGSSSGKGSIDTWVDVATAVAVTASGKTATTFIKQTGIIRMNVGGTISPFIQFVTTAPGASAVVATDSYIEFIPIGPNTMTLIGPWN